jgi:hypothetical protein
MAYSIWDYDLEEWNSHGQRFPRSGMDTSVRKDPATILPNCPADLQGPPIYGDAPEPDEFGFVAPAPILSYRHWGWFEEVSVVEGLGADQKHGAPVWGSPDFEAGTVTKTTPAEDMTSGEVALTLAERQAVLHARINPERERRWRASSPLAFDALGDGSVLVPVDIRSDEDLRNIQAITITAQILGQINQSAEITFRGADNVSYQLTPEQVLGLGGLGLAVSAHINGFYAASWALKDSIATAESLAALAGLDPLADQHWPKARAASVLQHSHHRKGP